MERRLKVEVTSWDYLRELFKADDKIALFLHNKQNGEGKQVLLKAEKAWAFKYQKYLQAMNSQGFNIYIGMNPIKETSTHRQKEDIREIKRVFLDIDHDGEKVKNALLNDPAIPKPNYLIESSPGKYQFIWNVKGFDLETAEGLIHGMAVKYGGDEVVRDISRVMRIPGFRNKKPDYQKIDSGKGPLVGVRKMSNTVYSREDFKLDLSKIEYRATGGRKGAQISPDGITQSERDWSFVKRNIDRGADPEFLIAAVAEYREPDGKGKDYARRTVEKAVDVMKARDLILEGENPDKIKHLIMKEGSKIGNRNPDYPNSVMALAQKEVEILSKKNDVPMRGNEDKGISR